jgi:Protein kinase domain
MMAQLPASIGRYQVRERIGQGGMGVLYLAVDPMIDRSVAIKLLRVDNDELRERFVREARSAGRLQHPNIVTIFDVGEHQGQPFIAMEYIAGETFAELIRRRAPLPLGRKVELVADLCGGLAFAHKAGIIHRDVKPANIMVTRDGILKILDFGIARVIDSGMTQVGTLMGTPNYMSPEQVAGGFIDHRSDIFCVGLVLYELLVLRQAFPGDSAHVVVNNIMTADPVPLLQVDPQLDSPLVQIAERALKKDPNARYPDLSVMRAELTRVAQRLEALSHDATVIRDLPATPVPTPPGEGIRRSPDRERLAQRRAAQIETLLASAARALDEGNYEGAIEACEQAATLDPDEQRAHDLIERATLAINQRQIRGWLEKAREELSHGALTAASRLIAQSLELDPRSSEALAIQRELLSIQEDRQRAAERDRAIQHALEHARRLLEEGAFESAIRSAGEVLAHDPGHSEASAIRNQAVAQIEGQRQREQHDQRAREAIQAARVCFRAGRRETALEDLGRFSPPHQLVSRALIELRREAEAIERHAQEEELRRQREAEEAQRRVREAEVHRAEAERLERQRRIAVELAGVRDAIAAAQYERALTLMRQLAEAEPAVPELSELGEQAQAGLAATRAEARRRAQVEADERRRRDTEERLAAGAAALARDDLEAAAQHADAAAQLDANDPHLLTLRSRIELARAAREERSGREEHNRRAHQAVAASRRDFLDGNLNAAFARLEAFQPPHDLVTTALADLRREAEAAERHEQALKAEAEARRRRESAERLAEGRLHLAAGRFAEATELVELILRDTPQDVEALQLRERIRQAEHEVELASRASGIVTEARELAGRGRYREAIAVLERFKPKHPLVENALATLGVVVTAYERRARETVLDARRLFASGQQRQAITKLEHFAPEHSEVSGALQALRSELDVQEQRARPALSEARELQTEGRLADAIACLERVTPAPPSVSEALAALREQRAELERSRAEEARLRHAALQAAVEHVRAALLKDELTEAAQLLQQLEANFGVVHELDSVRAEIDARRAAEFAFPTTLPQPHDDGRSPVQLQRGSTETRAAAGRRWPRLPQSRIVWLGGAIAAVIALAIGATVWWQPTVDPVADSVAKATALIQAGKDSEALDAITQAIDAHPNDPALTKLLDDIWQKARTLSEEAQLTARRAGVSETSSTAFREGLKKEEEARSHIQQGRRANGARAFGESRDLFASAANSAPREVSIAQRVAALLAGGRDAEGLDMIDSALKKNQEPEELGRLLAGLAEQAERTTTASAVEARRSGASEAWSSTFRSGIRQERDAKRLNARRPTPDGIRALWGATERYKTAIDESTRLRQVVAQATGLYQQGQRQGALEVLSAQDPGHLRNTQVSELLNQMRVDGEGRAAEARAKATQAGASESSSPQFRAAATAQTQASEETRSGQVLDAIRKLWEAEQSYLTASATAPAVIRPPNPGPALPPTPPTTNVAENPGGPSAKPPSTNTENANTAGGPTPIVPPRPAPTVDDEVLKQVLERYRLAYGTGNLKEILRVYPEMPDYKQREYIDQRKGCKSVGLSFVRIDILQKNNSQATIETQTEYECTPVTRQPSRRFAAKDIFRLQALQDGAWTIEQAYR